MAVSAALVPSFALAAVPGQYGPPEWLPLRVSSDGPPYTVGCVKTNCTISGSPYHDFWAIDLLDHANQPGAPVFAAGKGRVTGAVGSLTACGPNPTPANVVYIDHGNGVFSDYVHMTTVTVVPGQWVDQNTQIGAIGAVGYTFPCPTYHLHFEVTTFGVRGDPGPLKACHGASLVTYPDALGYSSWDAVPPWQLGVWSDGSRCAATPPGSPTQVEAAPGDGQADVYFTAPASDGYDAITSYTVTASPGGAHATGPASPLTVAGLTNGRNYTFTVTATNGLGTGAPSSPSDAIVPAGAPGAPTRVAAVAGNRRATIRFTAPRANGSRITSYEVTASPGGAQATGAASPLTVVGLTNGRRYRFRVTAENGVDIGAASAPSNWVTPTASAAGAPKCSSEPEEHGEEPLSQVASPPSLRPSGSRRGSRARRCG